jgi:hypothetical protein
MIISDIERIIHKLEESTETQDWSEVEDAIDLLNELYMKIDSSDPFIDFDE